MPSADVTLVETAEPGFIIKRIAYWQEKLEARLRKRYAIPWAVAIPEIFLGWLVDCVTPDVYSKRGVDPQDPEIKDLRDARAAALAEVLEAANSATGLFDLPLSESANSSAITAGGPLSYAEQSPWTWADLQACDGRNEDSGGR